MKEIRGRYRNRRYSIAEPTKAAILRDKRECPVVVFYKTRLNVALIYYVYTSGYSILAGKPEGKKLLRKPRRKWEDNIKMDQNSVG